MLDYEKLKESLQTEAFKDLRKFLVYHLLEMESVYSVKEFSKAVDQAIEMKGQKRACEILRSVLEKLIGESEIKEIKDEKTKEDYGL